MHFFLQKLSCLYGNDMKKRKRGRILMVSSMAGLTSAAPNTAFYGKDNFDQNTAELTCLNA